MPRESLDHDSKYAKSHEYLVTTRETPDRSPSPRFIPHEVRCILREIDAHLFDMDLNVARVRERCGIHNHNVSSRFKLSLGIGIRDYIEAQRIEEAKRILRESDYEVYYIASRVGYTYVETFARAFSRVVGCTPGEYRAARWGET